MVIDLFQHDSGNKNNYNDVKITDNCRGGTSNLTKAGSQQSRLRPCAHYSHPVAKMIIFSLSLKMSYAHFATTVVSEHDVYRVPQKSAIFFSLFLLLTIIRIWYVIHHIHSSRCSSIYPRPKKNRTKPVKTLVVLGSGGHTTEMIELLSSLSPERYTPLAYVIASTDTTSYQRLRTSSLPKSFLSPYVYTIPRSREVGQSYFTSLITTLHAIFFSFHIVFIRFQPELLICNGPGTCLPIIFWTFIWKVLGLGFFFKHESTKIIFVESFCRVTSLSLTGKLVIFVVDRFLVHWEELLNEYQMTELLQSFRT